MVAGSGSSRHFYRKSQKEEEAVPLANLEDSQDDFYYTPAEELEDIDEDDPDMELIDHDVPESAFIMEEDEIVDETMDFDDEEGDLER